LFILLLSSNCAGTKPFFKTGKIPALTPPHSTYMTHVNRYSDSYSYIPTSAEENGIFTPGKGQYKFSVSLPVKARLEF
ncbi:MAG: hypothetical protein PVG39_15415, partial [Desulfobacteraceae bacterium]